MSQLFRPGANTIGRLVLLAIPVLPVVLMGVAFVVAGSGYVTGEGRIVQQPVPFSHAHHAGQLGIDCRYCHQGVETNAFAGMPTTHTCMTCHSQLYTDAEMLAPVRASLAAGQPLAWQRANALPDYAYFDHHVHVRNGVGCTTCHGQVGEMPLMRQDAPLTMGWCLDCHRDPAGHLRPAGEIFAPTWHPPGDQAERGDALMTTYAIDTTGLADCSVCHR